MVNYFSRLHNTFGGVMSKINIDKSDVPVIIRAQTAMTERGDIFQSAGV